MLTPAFDPKCNVSTSHTFWVINHKTEIISRPFPFPLFLRSVFMSWQIKHINKSHKALSFGNPQANQWVSSKHQRNHQRCVQVSSIGCQIETQINSLHILIKQGIFCCRFYLLHNTRNLLLWDTQNTQLARSPRPPVPVGVS